MVNGEPALCPPQQASPHVHGRRQGAMSFSSAVPYLICDCPDGRRDLRLESGAVWRLGRNPNCSIELKDETISRNHAMIQRADNGEFLFIDLGSQNGSFV